MKTKFIVPAVGDIVIINYPYIRLIQNETENECNKWVKSLQNNYNDCGIINKISSKHNIYDDSPISVQFSDSYGNSEYFFPDELIFFPDELIWTGLNINKLDKIKVEII